MEIDHVTVCAMDIDGMSNFLNQAVGVQSGFRPKGISRAGHWLYEGNQAIIHIVLADTPNDRGVIDHVAFRGSDAQSVRNRMKTHGLAFDEINNPHTDSIQFFVQGPENLKVEIVCNA